MKDFATTTSFSKTIVVYNSLNHDSLLAAAIFKTECLDSHAVNINRIIPDDRDLYVWIGVEPTAIGFALNKKAEHVVISDIYNKNAGYSNRDPKTGNLTSNKHPLSFKNEFFLETHKTISLCERVCDIFEFRNENYHKLGLHATNFHERETEKEFLVFIYVNLVRAEQSLVTGLPFTVSEANADDERHYFETVEKIKKDFPSIYRLETMYDQEGSRRQVVCTTMNDFSFHIALRMIRLVHKNFANTVYGMNGLFVYTNLDNIKFAKIEDHPSIVT